MFCRRQGSYVCRLATRDVGAGIPQGPSCPTVSPHVTRRSGPGISPGRKAGEPIPFLRILSCRCGGSEQDPMRATLAAVCLSVSRTAVVRIPGRAAVFARVLALSYLICVLPPFHPCCFVTSPACIRSFARALSLKFSVSVVLSPPRQLFSVFVTHCSLVPDCLSPHT